MKRRGEDGQALVIVALGLTVLLLAAGLGLDMGYLRYQKRRQQSAADSAAIAGASEIKYGDVTQAAQTDAASNGFTDGSNNVTVTVNNPPASGPHTGVAGYVEVLVTKIHPTFFAKAVGFSTVTVTARAVAYAQANGSGCMYALDPIGIDTLMVGNNQITAQCGIIIDSNSANAVDMVGVNTIHAAYTGIVGGDALVGSNTFYPSPVTHIVAPPDPLLYLDNSKPSISTPCSGGATYPSITGNGLMVTITPGSSCYNVSIIGSNNTVILSPGSYGNVTIAGSNNTVTLGAGQYGNVSITGTGTLTLNPGQYGSITGTGTPNEILNAGVYVITSGGLQLTGTNGLRGTGVTFYLGPNAGAVNLTGADTTNLTAPTSGTYAGVLIFQDPANTHAATVTGSNGTVYNGTFYFPNATLTMTGSNSASSLYTILVCKALDLTGSNTLTFNADYSSLANGSPIKSAVLAE
jgi:hypothetical protein